MTCIIGIRTTAGVLLAGDSLLCSDSLVMEASLDQPKVTAIDHLGIGTCGEGRWRQIIQYHVIPALTSEGKPLAADAADDPMGWVVHNGSYLFCASS